MPRVSSLRTIVPFDPRSDYVQKLHSAYERGRLNVFVGAGLSQEAGFPGWDDFNKELMQTYLAAEIGSITPAAMLASSNIEPAAKELFGTLGRDAVADFVLRAARRRFRTLLANVLYGGRTISELPLKSAHHQIASLSKKAHIFTLNFDPLLELALAVRSGKENWQVFRSPSVLGIPLRKADRVEHLHGWIDPGGRTSPGVVLTESDYLELTKNARARANKILKKMLDSKDTTLILGMSLADTNFRRVLYFLHKQKPSSRERIYVVMRRASAAVDHYARIHWADRGLRLLFVEEFDEIPGLLRDIQWGESKAGDLPHWIPNSIAWRENRLPNDAIFTDLWQYEAYKSLYKLSSQIRSMFGVPGEEKINLAIFVPFWENETDARLRMIVSSRKFTPGVRARYRAKQRVLSIRKGREQGVAGVCFATGTNRSVAFGEGEVDINFGSDKSNRWISEKGYRDWRSIIALPVIDTEQWIPVAVIALTSNMANPFWKQFGLKQNLLEPELNATLRRTASFCLSELLPGLLTDIKYE